MSVANVAGLKIHVEQKGEGPPVLYISGTGADLRQKPNVLDGPLAEAFHVITYDQRGLGQTEKPEGPYSMAQYADDAAKLIAELGYERLDVVGVSFGGMVAQHLAIRHPNRINRLVLCCTSAGGDSASFPFHELPDDLSPIDRLMLLMPISDTRRDKQWQLANPKLVERIKSMTASAVIADHSTEAFKKSARLQLEARKYHDTNADLLSLSVPTLICSGKYDGIAPIKNQERLKKLLRGSTLNLYEGGHLFLLQDKQAWKDIISFLST